jgi:hypothetical protein
MNKKELTDIVGTAYGIWNKELPMLQEDREAVYRGWWMLLSPYEVATVEETLQKLSRTHQYLPPTGIILNHLIGDPTPSQAWNIYCRLRDSINNGTASPDTIIHPRIQQTIQQVGMNLHTNDDRRHFTETYNSTL